MSVCLCVCIDVCIHFYNTFIVCSQYSIYISYKKNMVLRAPIEHWACCCYCSGKGFLLTFIAYRAFFKSNFAQYKNKNGKTKPNKKEIRFCINRLIGLSLSLSHTLLLLFIVRFSLSLSFSCISTTAQHFRFEKRVKCLHKMPYKMFGIMKSHIEPDQTMPDRTSQRTKELTKNNNNVENVDLRTTSRFIAD